MASPYEPDTAHRDAIAVLLRARLLAQGSTGIAVYVDEVPDPPELQFPYLVIWSSAGNASDAAERLAGWGGEITTTHQITAAGLTVDDVLGTVSRCRYALHRQHPEVPGRQCGDVSISSGGSPVPDPPAGPGARTVYSVPLFAELMSN